MTLFFLLPCFCSCKEYNNWYSFFAVVMALNSVAVSRLSQTWEVSGKWLLIWVAFIFSRKKFDFYDFICKYVKRLICLSSNIARKRYLEIKSFVNYGPLWKHLLNYFF